MKIRIANSAGFCYGVRRAVELAEGAAGPASLCDAGSHHPQPGHDGPSGPPWPAGGGQAEEVPEGSEVIIRSHGESRAVHEGRHAGASASWTPPVPMLPVSIRSWPGLRSRGGSPSSSEPGTTRRCCHWRAGVAARWSCLERRSWKTGWRRTRPDAKCHSLLCPRPRPSAGFGIPA